MGAVMTGRLAVGVAAHQAGRLDQAEALYREILTDEPEQPDALHLLGVIHHQRGDDGMAVTMIGKAIALKGTEYKYHYNLAAAFQALGRFAEARSRYRAALALVPESAAAGVHLALAHLLQGLGQPAEAEPHFRCALALSPGDAAAHAGLGAALHALNRLEAAVACYQAALVLRPEDAGFRFALGGALQTLRRFEEAEECYRSSLDHTPDHPPTLVNLGTVLHAQGRLDNAAACHRRAIAVQPDFTPAHVNLGAVFQAQGRMGDAVRSYRQALTLSPTDATAHYNLGTAVQAVGWLDEALRCYRDALRLWPSYGEACNNLGQVLEAQRRLPEAAAAFRRGCTLRPERSDFHYNLGCCLALLFREDAEAARVEAAAWLAEHPDQPIARHMAAALGAGDVGSGQPVPGYVRSLFDGFAPSFDHELLSIGYCGPELMAASFAKVVPIPRGDLAVLDAGCGTGLCAPVLRPWAKTLTGVDLSPRMLDYAARRDLYDTLVTAEIVDWLQGHRTAFDLIAVADVLCYLGDLAPVIAALAAALRPGGALAFTAEQAFDPAVPFVLAPHGRYLHGETPLRALLARHGLAVRDVSVTNLRNEDGRPSPTLVVLAVVLPI